MFSKIIYYTLYYIHVIIIYIHNTYLLIDPLLIFLVSFYKIIKCDRKNKILIF